MSSATLFDDKVTDDHRQRKKPETVFGLFWVERVGCYFSNTSGLFNKLIRTDILSVLDLFVRFFMSLIAFDAQKSDLFNSWTF